MAKSYTPRRVRDEDERSMFSSNYIQLEEGDKFLGYALFDGNPAEDEPGYYEFFDHWINAQRRSFPCIEDNCPWCEEGERPRNRAKSAWFVTEDSKGNEINQVMTFNMNGKLIRQFTDFRKEGEKIKGRLFRVSLISDRGDYTLMPKTDVLKAAEVKEHLQTVPDYEADLVNQAKKAGEAIAVARAMDQDDEPEEEPEEEEAEMPTKGKGKGKPAPEPEEGQEWPEEGDDEIVTVAKVDEDNTIVVESEEYDDQVVIWGTFDLDLTPLEEGDVITVSYVTDGEGDKVATEFEAQDVEPAEDAEDGVPDVIEDVVFEVVGVNDAEWNIDVKNDDMETTIYILDTMKPDFDDYKVGAKIKVSAEKDRQGDLVATDLPEVQKATRAKSSTPRKTTTRKTTTTRRKTTAAKK